MTFTFWSSYIHLPRARIIGDTTPNTDLLASGFPHIPTFHTCVCLVLVWIWVLFVCLFFWDISLELPISHLHYNTRYEPPCQVYLVWWIETRAVGTWGRHPLYQTNYMPSSVSEFLRNCLTQSPALFTNKNKTKSQAGDSSAFQGINYSCHVTLKNLIILKDQSPSS